MLCWTKIFETRLVDCIEPNFYADNNANDHFLQLTEFETFIRLNELIEGSAAWISIKMRNLERIRLSLRRRCLNVPALQTLLTMPKLKQIVYLTSIGWGGHAADEVIQYCAKTPGLKLEAVKVPKRRSDFEQQVQHTISVDQSTFDNQVPVLNI
jgi:hypothetical protein